MTHKERLLSPNETSPLSQVRTEVKRLYREAMTFADDNLQSRSSLHELHQRSARNLLHYVALRRHDVRGLQQKLAALGLSSLGRAEAAVAENLHAVLRLLRRLLGEADEGGEGVEPALTLADGKALLERNTETLLGPRPTGRAVRIMVTMPSEAQHDYGLVRDLVSRGMDCMGIS